MRGILIVTYLLASSTVACGGGSEGGGGANSGGGGGGNKVDACAIATQQDATTLFGEPAVKTTGATIVDPSLLGECLWDVDAPDGSSQLLQFHIWGSETYYSKPPNAEDYAIGSKGYLDTASLGVDIGWVQDGHTLLMAYSSIGPSAPAAATKIEPMKTLAKKIEASY